MEKTKHIVYLGCSGFPYGLAEIQKIILISEGLIMTGNTVTVIARKGYHSSSRYPELQSNGNFKGIEYAYTSGYPFRPEGFLKRNVLKVKGVINEFRLLRKKKKNNELDYAILSTRSFGLIFYYTMLSRLLGFKTIMNYVEYYSGWEKKWYQFMRRFNDTSLDKYATRLSTLVFPISDFLIAQLRKNAPGKKYLKVPLLTDTRRFTETERSPDENYFLFCGAAVYAEIIQFSIDAYNKVRDNGASLYLVVNGTAEQKALVTAHIEQSAKKDRIKMFSGLPEPQLNYYYQNAKGLLIPLRPTIQDEARFPHKIGEYLSTGNPVVSTNYGEIKAYFKDMQNMLIAATYDVDQFVEKMQFIVDSPEAARQIGLRGKEMVINVFDYRNYAGPMNDFLNAALDTRNVFAPPQVI